MNNTILANQSSRNKPFYSVKQIFEDHWLNYSSKNEVRGVEREEVEKMLSCKGFSRGCFIYFCQKCLIHILVPF